MVLGGHGLGQMAFMPDVISIMPDTLLSKRFLVLFFMRLGQLHKSLVVMNKILPSGDF